MAKAFKDAKLGGDNTVGIAVNKDFATGYNDLSGFLNGYGAYYNTWIKDSSGKLVFGTIQPEMKNALQKLQQMYKDGLISQDFSVKDASKAGEDVVAGKCGISYGTIWAPLCSIKDNMVKDTTADWECIACPTVDGSAYKSAGHPAPGTYIFVKKGCAHPEAAVKAVNLGLKLSYGDPTHYMTTSDGFEVFKYKFGNVFTPWGNLRIWKADTEALKTGDVSKLAADEKRDYDAIEAGLKGDRANLAYNLIFGQDGSEKYVNELKDENRIVVDAYQSLPTDTQATKGNDLNTNLNAAMLKIIMGDDINNFDKAVAEWKAGGGDQITEEVNDWYTKNN